MESSLRDSKKAQRAGRKEDLAAMIVQHIHNSATMPIIAAIDTVGYKKKPANREIGAIRNRLSGSGAHIETNIYSLAKYMEQGKTVQGALLRDKLEANEDTDSRFIQQQLFCIDIDNTGERQLTTPEAIQSVCNAAGITPAIIAESFSSSEKLRKYHAFFISDKPVKDAETARAILLSLQDVFEGAADPACKDPGRLIFGTAPDKQVIISGGYTPIEALTATEPKQQRQESTPAPAPQSKAKHNNSEYQQAEPAVLLGMIDVNALSYEAYLSVLCSFKAAGGSLEDFLAWDSAYNGKKRDFLRADAKMWKSAHGKKHTVAGLKHFAALHSPAAYAAYIAELSPAPDDLRQRKPKKAKQESSGEAAGIADLTPLETPFKRPANYVDFVFKNSYNKIVLIPQLLAENMRKTCNYIFVKGADSAEQMRRFWYEHGVYIPINDEFIKDKLRERIKPFGVTLCKKSYIEEAFYHLTIDPAFCNNEELNPDENIINFKNGLLHLDTMQLTAHTPEYLSTIQIPCNYNSELSLSDAPTFDRFITHLANNDKDSKQTLLEYIGAAISNVIGAHFKKALFLKGQGNCGKSQYILLLSKLLTERYFGSKSLAELESRFGKYILYNKRVVGDPDLRFMKMPELEVFKKATGGDPIDLESKGKNSFTYRYNGLLLFGCNKPPRFGGDKGDWVYNRMLFINCGDPIPQEEQDPLILDKMYAEREAIVAAAVAALLPAIKNHYTFTESLESKKAMAAYKAENDIVQEFLMTCCKLRNNGFKDKITKQALFNAFLTWARNCNYRTLPTLKEFKTSISQYTGLDINDLERKSNGDRYYIYTLTDEAKREMGLFDSVNN